MESAPSPAGSPGANEPSAKRSSHLSRKHQIVQICCKVCLTRPPSGLHPMPSPPANSNVTRLLKSVGLGDRDASDELLKILLDELRGLARQKMQGLPPNQTLQPTALVNEAFLRLAGRGPLPVEDRRDFMRLAARAMHDVLVEAARRKSSLKRRAPGKRIEMDDAQLATEVEPEELLALDEILEDLSARDGRKAEIVRLRFFVGLAEQEIAEVLDISLSSVRRDWSFARSWMSKELRKRAQ